MISPITSRGMTYKSELTKVIYRGVKVEYTHRYWLDEENNTPFTTPELDVENLKRVNEAWSPPKKVKKEECKTIKLLRDLENKYKSHLSDTIRSKLTKTINYERKLNLEAKIELINEIRRKL